MTQDSSRHKANVLRVADKYITRTGQRTAPIDADTRAQLDKVGNFRPCLAATADIAVVAAFLAWQEKQLWSGVDGNQAWEAFCRMINLDPSISPATFRRIWRKD